MFPHLLGNLKSLHDRLWISKNQDFQLPGPQPMVESSLSERLKLLLRLRVQVMQILTQNPMIHVDV